MQISQKNKLLYARETDAEFELRLQAETDGMNECLAAGHRTRQKARRTHAKRMVVAEAKEAFAKSPSWLRWATVEREFAET